MSSRQRKPTNLTLRWWSGTAGCAMKGRKGNRDRRPCSPTAECQTNLGLPVNSVSFLAQPAERRKAGRFHGYCCGLAPGEASRCYCLAFGDRRSLAPYWQAEPAPTGPRATTRGILLLAGRSLAAILLLGRYAEHRGLPVFLPPRARACCASKRTRSAARVRRREPRSGEVRDGRAFFPGWHQPGMAAIALGCARIFSWLSRQIADGRKGGRGMEPAK